MSVNVPTAGALSCRVQIWRVEQEPNDLNFDPDDSELKRTLIESVWGELTPVSAQVFCETAQTETTISHRLKFRLWPGHTDIKTLTDSHIELAAEGLRFKVRRGTPVTKAFVMYEVEALETEP